MLGCCSPRSFGVRITWRVGRGISTCRAGCGVDTWRMVSQGGHLEDRGVGTWRVGCGVSTCGTAGGYLEDLKVVN
jgi:hypothetical protein